MSAVSLIEFSIGTYMRWRHERILEGAPAGQLKDPIVAVSKEEWMRVQEASKRG